MKGSKRAGSLGHSGESCCVLWSVAAEGPRRLAGGSWWLREKRGEPAKPAMKRKGIWRQRVISGLVHCEEVV